MGELGSAGVTAFVLSVSLAKKLSPEPEPDLVCTVCYMWPQAVAYPPVIRPHALSLRLSCLYGLAFA